MSDDVAGVNEHLKAATKLPTAPAMPAFRRRLLNWTPVDEAAWLLGQALGLFPGFDDFYVYRHKVGPRWSVTPLGNALGDCLENLRKADKLERRTEADYEYRWVANRHSSD